VSNVNKYAIVEYLDYQIPDFQLNHIRQNKEEGYSRVPRLSDTRYLAVPRLSDTRYSAVPRLSDTRYSAIVLEYLDYQIPVTQLNRDMQVAKRD